MIVLIKIYFYIFNINFLKKLGKVCSKKKKKLEIHLLVITDVDADNVYSIEV